MVIHVSMVSVTHVLNKSSINRKGVFRFSPQFLWIQFWESTKMVFFCARGLMKAYVHIKWMNICVMRVIKYSPGKLV